MTERIGLKPGTRFLYIEREHDYWVLPTNCNHDRTLGTFLRLYNDGRIESVYVDQEPPYERVELIKPKDIGE